MTAPDSLTKSNTAARWRIMVTVGANAEIAPSVVAAAEISPSAGLFLFSLSRAFAATGINLELGAD